MSWRYAAASIAGASHRAAETPCQDRHRCDLVAAGADNPTLIAVVSDGAGSARRGARGAELATELVAAEALVWLRGGGSVRDLDRTRVAGWLERVRAAIFGEAEACASEPRDFAATLLFALLDARTAAFGQIGDGAIVTSAEPGEWLTQWWPRHGTYANQTFFITDADAPERLAFGHSLFPITEVALFTDGLERVLLDFGVREPHGPAFESMLGPLRAADGAGHMERLSSALAGYLASPAVASRTGDDITLVIGTRRAAPGEAR
jgi:hypothetical protein